MKGPININMEKAPEIIPQSQLEVKAKGPNQIQRSLAALSLGASVLISGCAPASGGGTGGGETTYQRVQARFTDEIIASCDSNTTGAYNYYGDKTFSYADSMNIFNGATVEKAAKNGDGLLGTAINITLSKVDEKLLSGKLPEDLTVLSMCGSNDLINSHTPREIADKYATLKSELQNRGVALVVISVPHAPYSAIEQKNPQFNLGVSEVNSLLQTEFTDKFIDLSESDDFMTYPGQTRFLKDYFSAADLYHLSTPAATYIADRSTSWMNSLHDLGEI